MDSSIGFTQAFPSELLPAIWQYLEPIAASRVRETSKKNELVINSLFPEMLVWQGRCQQLMMLKQIVAICNEEKAISQECKQPIDFFMRSKEEMQIKALKTIIRLHRQLILLEEKHPLSRLLGGVKAILKMPEKEFSNSPSSLAPRELPRHVMKGIDSNRGRLCIFVRDQFASFYAIEFEGMIKNSVRSYPIVGGGSQTFNSNNTNKFNTCNFISEMALMEMNRAKVTMLTTLIMQPLRQRSAQVLTPLESKQLAEALSTAHKEIDDLTKASTPTAHEEELPLWKFQQYINGPVGFNRELCFGSYIDSELYQMLEKTMTNNNFFGQT